MFQEFYQHCKNNHFWMAPTKLLLAISGGIDSMVLLDLMQQVANVDCLDIGVVHVNHDLRPESIIEYEYLKNYCNQQKIPFYSRKWQTKNKVSHVEERARNFRYTFFSEIMQKHGYSSLITAHHSDDQAETILMKLIRGSAFTNFVGIRSKQSFSTGTLIRPLLLFSKESLAKYAQKKKLTYFEDASNQENIYTRNRIRNQVIPILKKENEHFLKHMTEFSQQIKMASEIIEDSMALNYERWVKEEKKYWKIDLTELKYENKSQQLFFLMFFFQKSLIQKNIAINKAQLNQIVSIINQVQPQMKVDIGQGWEFSKSYDNAYLQKSEFVCKNEEIIVLINESVFLSEREWFAIELVDKPIKKPKKIQIWKEYNCLITEKIALPLTLRHRVMGDKIRMTEQMSKKISRVFIDKKIPNKIREEAWIVCTADQTILWVPKFVNSYLSIPQETDKILYRLIYKVKE